LAFGKPDRSGVLFLVNAIPWTLSSVVGPYMQGQDGRPLWVLDHSVVHTGTVVPQALWSPQGVNDIRCQLIRTVVRTLITRFFEEDELFPVFFVLRWS